MVEARSNPIVQGSHVEGPSVTMERGNLDTRSAPAQRCSFGAPMLFDGVWNGNAKLYSALIPQSPL